MVKTNLSRVLEFMEHYQGPLSLSVMARELGQSPERTREYVEYWMRRGRIQEVGAVADCSACGQKNGCPFIMKGPKTYQLSNGSGEDLQISCSGKIQNC
jgi:hypothetical protein